MKTQKKTKTHSNKIHNTKRTQDSNFITTFLDNYQSYFKKCGKFSSKSSNLNYFYSYYFQHYGRFKNTSLTLIGEDNLPKSQELDLYLDNIGSGDLYQTKKQYESKITVIFKLLAEKYRSLLEQIFQVYEFTPEEIKLVNLFLQKLLEDKLREEQIVEWYNLHGKKLARAIYICILDNKFPKEISQLIGFDPEIYGEFTSLDIQKDIELNLPYGKKLEYQMENIKLNLKVYSGSSNFQPSNGLLDKIFFLYFIQNKKEINLTLWLSKKKKELKHFRKQRYIGPKEINSGATSFGPDGRQVSIWREEELNKVLLHELFHSLDLEDRMNTADLENFVYQHFDVRRDLNKLTIFENYVELMADILNVFFLVEDTFYYSVKKSLKLRTSKKVKMTPKKLLREKKEMFRDIIWIEKCWAMFQAAKVLHYFRYSRMEDFYFSQRINETQKTAKYMQKSNVFSYIILRSLCFFRLNKFLGLCREYNTSNLLEYNIPTEAMIKFWKDTLDKSKYVEQMNQLLALMREIETKKNTKAVIFKSMRMTCVESK